ncbi:hypothetical protein HanPSC8_Chr01g0022901 [Helianthus annuus]|nr:hypothetical protein HanPSC8_Chr01g0022901 [Helianthus annuus]
MYIWLHKLHSIIKSHSRYYPSARRVYKQIQILGIILDTEIYHKTNQGYLDWGENGEIPYDPIYLTSRTICQPKMHLPLQDFEKVLLEHQ